jgi:thioredoxin-related protein
MYRFILSFFFFLPTLSIQADNGFIQVKKAADWEMVLEKAKAKNKLILVDMYTDWCGYCKMMDRNVFSNEDYQKELSNQFVPVKMDGESKFGEKFVTEYGIQGFPTFLFFDAQGKLIDQVAGYKDLNEFRESTNRIFDRSTNKKKLDKKFSKGKLNNVELAKYYTLTNNVEDKEKITTKLLSELTDDELLSGPYDAFLFAVSTSFDQRGSKLILDNRALLIDRNGDILYEQFIEKLFNTTMDAVIKSGDQAGLVQLETELLPAYVNDEAALPQAKLILRKLYHGNRGEWLDYERIVEQQWETYPAADQYYNEAYALLDGYIEDPSAMELAENWLLQGINKQENFQSHLLLAVIQLMQGKEVLGKQSLGKADALAKTDEEKAQVKELIRMAEEG